VGRSGRFAGRRREPTAQALLRYRKPGAVSDHRGSRPSQAAVQALDVALASRLPRTGAAAIEAGEGPADRQGLCHVADHDGHPPLAPGISRHIPVREDVTQRALARADHADEVQQAVDAERDVLLEAALPPDEQLDPA
jgi:hypothetical protein